MELPAALRVAVDRALNGVALADLQRAAATLSSRYRSETRDGRLHLADDMAMQAYLAVRLPATFAAVRSAMEAVAIADSDFAPKSLLDFGAGPGTALWAAADCWPDIEDATLLETSRPAREAGRRLMDGAPLPRCEWVDEDIGRLALPPTPADIVTLCYVLDELPPTSLPALVERLWRATNGMLLVVEPGTPAGWQRVLRVRDLLIGAGGHVVAPCPHAAPCPITAPDWCHFSRRVARSRLHRLAKSGDVPWEDEKYAFIAVSRHPVAKPRARVLAPPRASKGRISLKLCRADGTAQEHEVSKRDADAYRVARRLGWGDAY